MNRPLSPLPRAVRAVGPLVPRFAANLTKHNHYTALNQFDKAFTAVICAAGSPAPTNS